MPSTFPLSWTTPAESDRAALAAYLTWEYPGGAALLAGGVLDTPPRAALVSSDDRYEHPLFTTALAACERVWLDPDRLAGLVWAPAFVVQLLAFAADPDRQQVTDPIEVDTRQGARLLARMLAGVAEHHGSSVDLMEATASQFDAALPADVLAGRSHGDLIAGTVAELAAAGYADEIDDLAGALLQAALGMVSPHAA